MSDEIPSGRLSQIFESLSCLSELQQRQTNSPPSSLPSVPTTRTAQSLTHNYYIRHPDGSGYYLSSGTQTFPSASSQSHHLQQYQQYNLQQHRERYGSSSLTSSPLMTKRATSFSGQIPLTNSQGTRVHGASPTVSSTAVPQQQTSQSTPNSPRLLPRRSQRAPPIPAKPNAALIASPALIAMDADAPWPHFSTLTDHLDVHQVNNYAQAVPEINWQERCLELQLELHRSKNQAGRIRDMLREKLSELEQRVAEAEERAEEAEDKNASSATMATNLYLFYVHTILFHLAEIISSATLPVGSLSEEAQEIKITDYSVTRCARPIIISRGDCTMFRVVVCEELSLVHPMKEIQINASSATMATNLYLFYVHTILFHLAEIISSAALPVGSLSEEAQEIKITECKFGYYGYQSISLLCAYNSVPLSRNNIISSFARRIIVRGGPGNKDYRYYPIDNCTQFSRSATNGGVIHQMLVLSDPWIACFRPESGTREAQALLY